MDIPKSGTIELAPGRLAPRKQAQADASASAASIGYPIARSASYSSSKIELVHKMA